MEKLPVEILCHIFNQLPQKHIIKLTTVSKLFNEIIESNNLIKGLKVDTQTPLTLKSPKRKFSKVFIRDNNTENFIKALQATGDSIEEVTIEHHRTTLNSIVTILNLLPNAKKITFRYINLEDEDEFVDAVVKPLNDITLEFYETDPTIFKILHQVSVKKLVVRNYGDSPYYNFINFYPFITLQKHLISFYFGGIFESNLMSSRFPDVEFRLKEFSIYNSDLEEYVHLETFLANHVDTLEKLSIKDVHGWDPSNVINKCKKLKSLELEAIETNEITEEITSLEELSITMPNSGIDKFPNVRKLYIEGATVESNRIFSANMKKVEDLTIRFGKVNGCYFEKVKKLSLINTDEIENDVFIIHNKIEELALINYFHLNDEQLEAIVSNLNNLKVFKIHTMCKLTANSFQIMRKYCKNLRVLDMKTWSQQFNINDWKCLFDINGIEIYTENFNF
ncbi:hypothetical protein PVAND_007206 [Polypedilum vanderplanki]|uniref:F-box domain-containing protein n=1 Tax=Polypedilum vanderplanki TaxID=319348 RepID=A0A9J6C6H3_POLVA|nr:hypothetical protein PVAND_007206 [Polypedilum vanderplanki]